MDSKNLDSLVKIGQLKKEPFNEKEYIGLISSGKARLKDAQIKSLSPESRFDLAYNAAHALALAALRKCGYRANNRYIVFQVLPHTIGFGPEIWRVLSKCHDQRNLAEYTRNRSFFGVIRLRKNLILEILLNGVELILILCRGASCMRPSKKSIVGRPTMLKNCQDYSYLNAIQ